MKKSKILSIVMAVLMMAALITVPALAADDGVITINAPSGGGWTLEDQRFDAYRIFTVTLVGAGEYAYTLDSAFTAFQTSFGKGDLATYIAGITSGSDEMNELAAALWEYIDTTPVASKGFVVGEEDDTTVLIENLPYGYYLVYGSAIHVGDSPAIIAACSLTTTEPAATVNLKLDAPTLTKTVWHHEAAGADDKYDPNDDGWQKWTDINELDQVNFKVSVNVPEITGYDKYWLVVHDTLNYVLWNSGIGSGDYFVYRNGVLLTEDDDYTVDAASFSYGTLDPKYDAESNYNIGTYITFTFDPYLFIGNSGDVIDIIYSTTRSDLDTKGAPNKAYLEYSSNPYATGDGDLEHPGDKGDTTDGPPDEAWTYTFKFQVYKHTGDKAASLDTPLPGAKFQLYRVEGDSSSAVNFAGDSGFFRVVPDSMTVHHGGETITKTLVSSASGMIYIGGIDAGTYWLTEIEAPDGYNELEDPIKVVITHTDGAGTFTVDADALKNIGQINVRNNAGQKFPGTGGIGRVIFIVVGIVLMSSAIVAYVTRKKIIGLMTSR